MTLDADEAKRLIDILNTNNNSNKISETDVKAILKILNNAAKSATSNGNDQNPLDDAEMARFKQIALAALRYALALSTSSLDPTAEKQCKEIMVSGLLPLTNLPNWIESYILSAIELVVENVLYEQHDGNRSNGRSGSGGGVKRVNTMGIELLLSPYVARVEPDQAVDSLVKLCCMDGQSSNCDADHDDDAEEKKDDDNVPSMEGTKMLNPHAAASLAASLHEIQSTSPLLTTKHLSSLIDTMLQSLRTLHHLKEYDSIPPLIYQLCGLTKLTQPSTLASNSATTSRFSKKDSILSYKILQGIAHFLTLLDAERKGRNEVRWTISTSLCHLGRILRNNPSLPTVLLNIIKGKQQKQQDSQHGKVEPLMFQRMKPMLLAMGLTMASSIPRMNTSLLEAVRDLVLEEETVRWKRCSSRYVNSTIALLNCHGKTDNEDTLLGELKKFDHDREDEFGCSLNYQSHMMHCMKILLVVADSKSGDDGFARGNSGDDEFSSLHPILVSLGFMLIDTVKKDPADSSSNSVGAYTLPPIPTCASEIANNSTHTVQQKAQISTAKIGRSILVQLFLHAGRSASDQDVVTDSGLTGMATASPLCRMMFVMACEKFCSMAPNAIEHSYLLRDLVFHCEEDSQDGKQIDGLGAHMMEEGFLPMIIDLLANIPGGGMPPLVATKTIIPVLSKLLKLSAKKGKRNRRKRNELHDHIDHTFLFAKKALFSTDVDRRKVAVGLLIMLIGVAAESPEDNTSIIEEAMGYLRRCITQHQHDVRLEAYSSLIALIPGTTDETITGANSPSQTQGEKERNDCQISSFVSQILDSHLERYIVLEEDKAVIEARRKRAIAHGTHLSQQGDMETDEVGEAEQESPLRLDMCISSARYANKSNTNQMGSMNKGSNRKKGSLDILTEAKNRITEPLSFVLAASIAATKNVSQGVPLIQLRKKMAACQNVDPFLKLCGEDNIASHEYYVNALSTCLLVTSTADTLMNIPDQGGNLDLYIVEKLFRLRTDALYRAAAIIAGSKTKKVKKKKQNSSDPEGEGKPESKQDQITVIDYRNETNRRVLEKYKESIEQTLECPAMSSEFLDSCLRECGILSLPSGTNDSLYSTQDEEDASANEGLVSNVDFRRFLLQKCSQLLSGRSLIMKTGFRFDVQYESNVINSRDPLKEYIGPSFVLGPILFAEFISLVQNRNCTSLIDQNESPLALIALRGFVTCIQRILSHFRGLQMEPKQRINGLLMTSTNTLFKQFPSFRERWTSRSIPANILQRVPETERPIMKLLFPFIMPITTLQAEDQSLARGGMLSEIITQGLDAEAMLFSQMLSCISIKLSPTCREIISLNMLECFEIPPKTEVQNGIIGLDYDHQDDCQKSASLVLGTAILLDGLIAGAVKSPELPGTLAQKWRNECGFTTLSSRKVSTITQRDLSRKDSNALVGNTFLLASSFTSSIGTTCHFDEMEDDSLVSQFEFQCTRIIASVSASSETVSKELSIASGSLLAAIENGLTDAEYLCFKLLPSMIIASEGFSSIQYMLTELLSAVGKLICATAPSADLFDDNGSFASTLLKSCKRLYAIYCKVIGYMSNYPKSATTPEHKAFLKLLSDNLKGKTMGLLLTLQEKKQAGTKVLADSKISLQGRIAGQVVFEIERCDNELLKLSSKLKSNGFEDESNYFEGKVSANKIRDFRIKKGAIQAARHRDANSGKRKRELKTKSKKPKQSKRKKMDEDNDEQDDRSQILEADSSMVGTEDERQSDDDRSCSGDDLVGNFILNSASESSSDEEDDSDEEM